MLSSTMTVRMDASEKSIISDFAKLYGISASQFLRKCALERIEDEIDIQLYKEAKAEYETDHVSYTLDETKQMLGLK